MDIQKTIQHLFAKAASTHSEHEAEAAILRAVNTNPDSVGT